MSAGELERVGRVEGVGHLLACRSRRSGCRAGRAPGGLVVVESDRLGAEVEVVVEAGRVRHPEGDRLAGDDRDGGQLLVPAGSVIWSVPVSFSSMTRGLSSRAGRIDRAAAGAATALVRAADERTVRIAPAGRVGRGVRCRLEVRVPPAMDVDRLRRRPDLAFGGVGLRRSRSSRWWPRGRPRSPRSDGS